MTGTYQQLFCFVCILAARSKGGEGSFIEFEEDQTLEEIKRKQDEEFDLKRMLPSAKEEAKKKGKAKQGRILLITLSMFLGFFFQP